MEWPARVSRTAGFRAWSVFSASEPPARSFPLKGGSVMIVEATGASSVGPILGTTSKHYKSQAMNLAPVQLQVFVKCPDAATAKLDQLESQAVARVTALEKRFDVLAESVAGSQSTTAKQVDDLHKSVSSLQAQVGDQAKTFETQLQSMFTKLANTQQASFDAMERSSQATLQNLRAENIAAMNALKGEFETGYRELRDILTNSPKARRVGDGDKDSDRDAVP